MIYLFQLIGGKPLITWYRFEDTYGMSDIFFLEHDVQCLDVSHIFEYIPFGDDFVTFGLGGRTFLLSSDDVDFCIKSGIDRIVFVFDTDNESGIKTKLVSESFLRGKFDSAIYLFEHENYSIDFKFVLTVYSAETVALYQCLSNDAISSRPERFVHKVDTQYFQLILLALNFGLRRARLAKRFRDFITVDMLNNNIMVNLSTSENEISKDELQWVFSRCSNDSYLLSFDELIRLLSVVNDYFTLLLQSNDCELTVDAGSNTYRLNSSGDLKVYLSYVK